MDRKTFQLTKFSSGRFLIITASVLLIHGNEACSMRRAGENFGQKAAAEIAAATAESSAKIESAMKATAEKLDISIRAAASALEASTQNLGNSMDKVSAELGESIRHISGDLVKIADKVSNSLDKSVEELGAVISEAIGATKEISGILSNSLDNAVMEIGKQIEHGTDKIEEIVKNLTNSVDKAVEEFGESLRYIANSFVEIAKQFNARIDSGDLIEVGKELKQAMILSITALTKNWEVAVNTMDLRDVGASAAAELAEALQNIKGHVTVRMEMDDNARLAIRDISIAVGIAFSVLFVALVIALKSCRSCVVKTVTAINEQACTSRGLRKDEENQLGQDEKNIEMINLNQKVEDNTIEFSTITDDKLKTYNSDSEEEDDDSLSSSTGYDTDDSTSEKKQRKKPFDKRLTKSYADYKERTFTKRKKKWERREERARRQALEKSAGHKLLSPD